METLILYLKTEEEKSLFEQLAKVLKVPFEIETTTPEDEYNLYGEGFKRSILDGQKAYQQGDTSQFEKIKTEDLWK